MTQRIKMRPHTDLFMRGAVYGDLIAYKPKRVQARNGVATAVPVARVKLDKLTKPIDVWANDIENVD